MRDELREIIKQYIPVYDQIRQKTLVDECENEIKKWAMGLLPKKVKEPIFREDRAWNEAIAEIRKKIEEG